MNSETIIVDLQGFKDYQNNFIIKEFSLGSKEYTQTFLVKPPFLFKYLTADEKKGVRWIEKNRKIFWSEGFIDYREFNRVIVPYLSGKKIFVKGTEKVQWVRNICSDCSIIDLGNKGCPKLAKLITDYCDNHNTFTCVYHLKECALKNVLVLKKWMIENNMSPFLCK